MQQKSIVLALVGLLVLLVAGEVVRATPVAFYDFENESGASVTDKAGPPYTNVTRDTTHTSPISFNGSTGLHLNGTTAAPVDLDQGADDELAGDFSHGLIFEATFQLDQDKTVFLASRYDSNANVSWGVDVFKSDAKFNPGQMAFTISEDGTQQTSLTSDLGLLVEVGKVYSVKAVFDPFKDTNQMSLTLTRLSDGDSKTTVKDTTYTTLHTSTIPTYLGARLNNGSVNFVLNGTLDDVRISSVPEPASLAVLGVGVLLAMYRRRS